MKKKRTHELTLASIVAVLTVLICSLMPLAARAEGSASGFMAAARSDADIDALVGQMLAAGDYAEGEALVCYLGEGAEGLTAQSDDPLASAERLSAVTVQQYAEATGDVIPATDGLTAQAEEEPVEILLVRDEGKSTEQLLRELLSNPLVLSAEPNYLAELVSEEELVIEGDASPIEHPDVEEEQPASKEEPAPTEVQLTDQFEHVASPDLTGYQWFSDGAANMAPQLVDAANPGVHSPNWNDPSKANASGVVAIMDSGVDYRHPDLEGVMYHFSSDLQEQLGCGEFGFAVRRDDHTDPMDYYRHGTHCAGIVAAQWNDYGVSGIANGVKLTAVCLAGLGQDISYSCDTLIRGYDFLVRAADAGVDLRAVNRSLTNSPTTHALDVMVRAAGERGIVTLVAAGNDSNDIDATKTDESMYQANPYLIRVCSSNLQDGRSNFSNYGKYTTDLFAPGSFILSTVPSGTESTNCYFPSADNSPLYLQTSFDNVDNGLPAITPYSEVQIDDVSNGDLGYDGDGSSCKLQIRTRSDSTATFLLDIPVGALGKDDIQDVGVALYCPDFSVGYSSEFSIMLADGSFADSWTEGLSGVKYGVTGSWCQFSLHIADPDAMEQELGHVTDEQGNTCIRMCVGVELYKEGAAQGSDISGAIYLDQIAVGGRGNSGFQPYSYMNGTSMATPCATGCAAIVSSNIDAPTPAARAATTVSVLKGTVRQAEGYSGFCKQNGQIDLSLLESADGLAPVIESAHTTEDALVVEGLNFLPCGTLLLGDEEAKVLSWSDTKITVAWPEGLSSSLVPITVRTGDGVEVCRALILEAPEGTTESALLYERELAPLDSPDDGRLETTSPISLVATEDGTLFAAAMDVDRDYGWKRDHVVHYLVQSDDQGASWTNIPLPQPLKLVKLAVGDGRLFVWGATPPDQPTAVFNWHLYGMDLATGEFEYLSSFEAHSEEVPSEGSLAYVGDQLYLVDCFRSDDDSDAPSNMRMRPFDADYRLTSDCFLLGHAYTGWGVSTPPLVATAGNSVYVCSISRTTNSSQPLDKLIGLERVDVGTDGSLSSTDLSSSLAGLTAVPDLGGISMAATEDSVFLIGENLAALLPQGSFHTDTFVLRNGADAFVPYERTLSHALISCTSSVCADGWLYAFGISRDEEGTQVGRATKLTDPEPEPKPVVPDEPVGPDTPAKPSGKALPKTGDDTATAMVLLACAGGALVALGLKAKEA